MKKTVLKIVLVLLPAFVVLPYIVAPVFHNYKLYRFNESISKIHSPANLNKVAQKKWFGILWGCGNHADYLVISVFRGNGNDRNIYDYFNGNFHLYCPESKSDAKPLIYKRQLGKWYIVTKEKTIDVTDSIHDFGNTDYLSSFNLESEETHYFVSYSAQGGLIMICVLIRTFLNRLIYFFLLYL